jgi:hypothetical protein
MRIEANKTLSQARMRRRLLATAVRMTLMASPALETTAAEMPVAFHVADDGLDGRAAPELTFDDTEYATLLTRDEDTAPAFSCVAAIALVDIGALDRAAGALLGRLDDVAERMPVTRIARQRLGVKHELTAPRASWW